MDPAVPLEKRLDDLIGRMTLEEKVAQMRDHATAIPRLNVPKYDWWNECLHGVARAGQATVFPQAIGLASTWDPDLVERVGAAVDELIAAGGRWLVVAHGGVVRAAVVHLTGAEAQRLAGPANCSVTVIAGGRLLGYAWTPRLSVT
jgi:broad specificity phosphatase PhoE